jgi:transcriptional regulator with XRE-family HTH domain
MKIVKADGEKAALMRAAKGWTQEVLAAKSVLSRRAIQRIERGQDVLLTTLSRVATSLGVEVKELLPVGFGRDMAADSELQQADFTGGAVTAIKTDLAEIEMILPGDLTHWSDAQAAGTLRHIAGLAGLTGSIRIVTVQEGSVILRLQMTTEDAERLIQAWDEGKLDQAKVIDIRPIMKSTIDANISKESTIVCNQHTEIRAAATMPQNLAEQQRAMIERLKHTDSRERQNAAMGLGRASNTEAVSALIEALSDLDAGVRLLAAEGLGKIGRIAAVEALIQALQDDDKRVQKYAAQSLGEIGDKSAMPALIQAVPVHGLIQAVLV